MLQTLGPFDGVWGHPAAYGGQGGWVYVLESAGGGYLRALSYGLNGQGAPALTSAATSAESFGYTSGSPLVTSNGTTAGSAVVWVVYAIRTERQRKRELRAYSAAPERRQPAAAVVAAHRHAPRSSRSRPPTKAGSTWAPATGS